MTYTRFIVYLTALTLTTSPAVAHLPAGEHGSLLAGASHPLFGLDHVIAMLAVGVWALQIGGRGIWAVPAGFVGAMTPWLHRRGSGRPAASGRADDPCLLHRVRDCGATRAAPRRVERHRCRGVFGLSTATPTGPSSGMRRR